MTISLTQICMHEGAKEKNGKLFLKKFEMEVNWKWY
jgi:hypothetical protein